MRLLISAIVVLILATIFLTFDTWGVKARFSKVGNEFWYSKDVFIEGLETLDRKYVEALLPLESSIPYWMLNTTLLETKIKQDPLIAEASLEGCDYLSWGCFKLTINERLPSFVALLGEKAWLIGKDGAVMHIDQAKRLNSGSNVPFVRGLFLDELSPDIIRLRAVKLNELLSIIEDAIDLRVKEVELDSSGTEYTLQFKEHAFRVIIQADAASLRQDAPSLEQQVQRLSKILSELRDKTSEVLKIDLTLDKMAVVRMNQ